MFECIEKVVFFYLCVFSKFFLTIYFLCIMAKKCVYSMSINSVLVGMIRDMLPAAVAADIVGVQPMDAAGDIFRKHEVTWTEEDQRRELERYPFGAIAEHRFIGGWHVKGIGELLPIQEFIDVYSRSMLLRFDHSVGVWGRV